MANNTTRLNFDELKLIARQLHHEGDDYIRLYSVTRQKMRSLQGEWDGRAAEMFFQEMEYKLLPGVQRLSLALFQSEMVLNKITNIIHEADEETTSYFKDLGLSSGQSTERQGTSGLFGGTLPMAAGGSIPSIAVPISIATWSSNLPGWLHDWVNRFFPPTPSVSPLPDEVTSSPEPEKPATGFGALLQRSSASTISSLNQSPAEASPSATSAATIQSQVINQPAHLESSQYDVYNEVPTKSQGPLYGAAACAPTSVSMVLDYFHNLDASHAAANPQELIKMLDKGDGTPGSGVRLDLMNDDLGELGYKNITIKIGANMDDLASNLKNGPVIVTTGVKLIGGEVRDIQQAGSTIHAMVVKGLNDTSVVVNDPWSGSEKVFSRATFDKMWNKGQNGIYVIQP